jgi:hypothetical protein
MGSYAFIRRWLFRQWVSLEFLRIGEMVLLVLRRQKKVAG